jgi:hypothetical protein
VLYDRAVTLQKDTKSLRRRGDFGVSFHVLETSFINGLDPFNSRFTHGRGDHATCWTGSLRKGGRKNLSGPSGEKKIGRAYRELNSVPQYLSSQYFACACIYTKVKLSL